MSTQKETDSMLRDKAQDIGEILDEFYPDPEIPLKHDSPFTLLIATLLSAQCTDQRVNAVTPLLFARASSPLQMSMLRGDEILSIVRPCGLGNQKASAISKLSSLLVDHYSGRVPCSFSALESLPGVGHKTASVVMAQAFAIPSFPVDTHIHRLAKRWGLSNGKSVVQTERDLKGLFPIDTWNKRHLQIIYFGREHCPARGHNPLECPICKKHALAFHEPTTPHL